MKITPMAAPGQPVSAAPAAPSNPAREAAIKALTGQPSTAPESTPSQDAPQVPAQPAATPDDSKSTPTADTLDARFKDLSVKEQTIRSAAKKLKEREAEYKANYLSKADLAKDLIGTLKAAGLYTDPTPQAATDSAPAPTDALASKIDSLQAEIAALKEGKQADQKSAYDSAVKQLQRETDSLIAESADFTTIKASKRSGDVVELIEKNFKLTGEVLSVKDAAKLVEDALLEEYKPLLESLKSKLAPAPVEPEATPVSDSKIQPKKHGMPVKVTSRSPQPANLTHKLNSNRPLGARERALKAFKGE